MTHELDLAKLKSDFVSTVSHEFKSPVTSIRQLAEMLQTGRVPSTDRRQKYYDVIVEQSERLSLLIDNVLDFAKMEEGRKQFNFERVDLGVFLRDLVTTLQHRVSHEGVDIQAEIEDNLPEIKVDRIAMMQAITNLIDNAVKYSDRKSKVIINSYAENQHAVISVRDFGVGIRNQDLVKVFDRFYRGGDELTRSTKGSRLGLTLVKQIVEAHHGSVELTSELGKGSTFTIKLPLSSSSS